jgi:hypothetical protein
LGPPDRARRGASELTAGAEHAETSADLGDVGEILDAHARSEYKQRIADLQAELDEATRWGDGGRAPRIREEIEFLGEELSSAFGIGGRARKVGAAGERARKAVASRVQDAIAKIRCEHPALRPHLANRFAPGPSAATRLSGRTFPTASAGRCREERNGKLLVKCEEVFRTHAVRQRPNGQSPDD